MVQDRLEITLGRIVRRACSFKKRRPRSYDRLQQKNNFCNTPSPRLQQHHRRRIEKRAEGKSSVPARIQNVQPAEDQRYRKDLVLYEGQDLLARLESLLREYVRR
jgi:hypothetical protein